MAKYNSHRSDQEWLRLINECRQSGMADYTWCEQHDISSSSFYNAVSRLRKKACHIPESVDVTCPLDLTSHQDVVKIDICPDLYPDVGAYANLGSLAVHLDNSHTMELVIDNICLKISNSAAPALQEQVLSRRKRDRILNSRFLMTSAGQSLIT